MKQTTPLIGFLLVALLSPHASARILDERWITYSMAGTSVSGADYEVEVSVRRTLGFRDWFWFAKKTTHGIDFRTHQPFDVVQWVDGRGCPALGRKLLELRALEPLSILMPGEGEQDDSIRDGQIFTLKAPGHFPTEHASGEIVLSGNFDTPLAAWVGATEKAIGSCWQDHPPA